MFDRFTNLLVLLCVAISLLVLGIDCTNAWESTKPWEREWVVKPDVEIRHPQEKLLSALRKANAASEMQDAKVLDAALETQYQETGKVLVRFSSDELVEIAKSFLASLFLLVIPLSINYLRHGTFRIWNRGT